MVTSVFFSFLLFSFLFVFSNQGKISSCNRMIMSFVFDSFFYFLLSLLVVFSCLWEAVRFKDGRKEKEEFNDYSVV